MGRGRPKKYLTEEERKAARKEYLKQYYRQYRQDNEEYYREYQKQYREDNKEYFKEHNKQYYEDNKEYIKEFNKQYYQNNKDEILEQKKQYREDNKEYFKEYQKQYNKQYYKIPMRRASALVKCYQRADKKYNRGECTLTPEWMVENIFSKPCHYCGETDWLKIGCDRIDNSKPHTPDNVVPCCDKCNRKRGRRDYEEFMLETILF